MTTNVYDSPAGMLATDSRWSVKWGNHRLIYVDDTHFNKIETYKTTAFMFAGKADLIQQWKSWIRQSPPEESAMPPCDGMSICVVDMPMRKVKFSERQDIVRDGAFFAGTGSQYAFLCWNVNRDARRAVESAKLVDFCTGGEVKFLELSTGKTNLSGPLKDVDISTVRKAITERGIVMDISQPGQGNTPPYKLSDLAANDADLRELQAKVANGEVSPEAPCDGMYSEWTTEQRSKLKQVLAEVFGWKR